MIRIVGAGGHGQDIAAICQARGLNFFLCDDDRLGVPPPPGTPGKYVIGVNEPQVRAKLVARFKDWSATSVVHPHVTFDTSTIIGWGCVVGPAVVMLHRCVLRDHVHVGYGVTMTRCSIGAFSTVAPGATICGDVVIGERVFIGAGAVIKNLVTIGDDAVIGAGAVVVDDVPAGVTVKGVPARA